MVQHLFVLLYLLGVQGCSAADELISDGRIAQPLGCQGASAAPLMAFTEGVFDDRHRR
jgi:hypothetical protein